VRNKRNSFACDFESVASMETEECPLPIMKNFPGFTVHIMTILYDALLVKIIFLLKFGRLRIVV
jgi:hypothetical protein